MRSGEIGKTNKQTLIALSLFFFFIVPYDTLFIYLFVALLHFFF